MEGLPARAALFHSGPPAARLERGAIAYHGGKSDRLRDAFWSAARYLLRRGPCHGNHSRKVSRPAAAEEGVCESGDAHAGRISAGDAGLVRLQGWSRSGEYREGTSES